MARIFRQTSLDAQDIANNLAPFQCNLVQTQCRALTNAGVQCRNLVTVGLPFCTMHWKKMFQLRPQPSNIPGAGTGLFAFSNNAAANHNTIVFAPGVPNVGQDTIVYYNGEEISNAELQRRYGNATGSYTMKVGDVPDVQRWDERHVIRDNAPRAGIRNVGRNIDAACYRSLGSLINHDMANPNVEAVSQLSNRVNRNGQHNLTGRILLKPLRPIRHGEELLLNYANGPLQAYNLQDNENRTVFARNFQHAAPAAPAAQAAPAVLPAAQAAPAPQAAPARNGVRVKVPVKRGVPAPARNGVRVKVPVKRGVPAPARNGVRVKVPVKRGVQAVNLIFRARNNAAAAIAGVKKNAAAPKKRRQKRGA